ncbi:MAG: tail fiber protein [Leptonema illini]|uniref:Tail fiber protein n=1 Tax=Leptonema illini TaxID=183 RepID=A0A833GX79_9LEPT|nr:MAG: tail fiber protein [Leptonema illini]
MQPKPAILSLIRSGFFKGVGFSLGMMTTGLFAAAAAMKVFSAGEVISATELNRNFAISAPEGAIMAFNLAECPEGWAAADGNNGTPDLRGRFIRGLNDFGTGASSVDPAGLRALRNVQDDAFQGHWHWRNTSHTEEAYLQTAGGGLSYSFGPFSSVGATYTGEPVTDGTNGNPRTAKETRPVNVGLIFCQRMN